MIEVGDPFQLAPPMLSLASDRGVVQSKTSIIISMKWLSSLICIRLNVDTSQDLVISVGDMFPLPCTKTSSFVGENLKFTRVTKIPRDPVRPAGTAGVVLEQDRQGKILRSISMALERCQINHLRNFFSLH